MTSRVPALKCIGGNRAPPTARPMAQKSPAPRSPRTASLGSVLRLLLAWPLPYVLSTEDLLRRGCQLKLAVIRAAIDISTRMNRKDVAEDCDVAARFRARWKREYNVQ